MSDVTEGQVADVAAVPDNSAPPAQQNVETQKSPETTSFSVPDAYKDKSWAAKVKSQDDVYKLVDNLNGLVGKKSVPFDYANADEEAIKAHHASVAPKDLTAYEFLKADDPVSKVIGDAFIANGITGYQGKSIVKSLAPVFQEMEAKRVSELKDGNKYAEMSKKAFGDGFEEKIKSVNKVLVDNVPKELGTAFDDMPNNHRHAVDVAIDKIVSSYEAKIADMVKKYGITESGAQVGGKQGTASTDKASLQKSIRAEIRALDARPHTAQEKQALIQRLNETYK